MRRHRFGWAAALIGLALLILGVLGWRWIMAEAAVQVALRQRQTVAADAQRIMELRGRQTIAADQRRPEVELIAFAQQALTVSGLPVHSFRGISPRADDRQTGSLIAWQVVQIQLVELTIPDFGAWLHAWNGRQGAWRIRELQLTHGSAGTPLDSPARYDITLVVAAPFFDPGDSP